MFSYPLMIGISFKLLEHSRRSYEKVTQVEKDLSLRDLRQSGQRQHEENAMYYTL